MEQETFTKWELECTCVLATLKTIHPTVWHRFTVFSVIKSDGSIKPHYAACNHCEAVWKVLEIGKAKQVAKDSAIVPKISDIKLGLPDKIVSVLDMYKCPLPTWQEAEFIFGHELWGTPVILTKEEDKGFIAGKYLLILGKELMKVDSFTQAEEDDYD